MQLVPQSQKASLKFLLHATAPTPVFSMLTSIFRSQVQFAQSTPLILHPQPYYPSLISLFSHTEIDQKQAQFSLNYTSPPPPLFNSLDK